MFACMTEKDLPSGMRNSSFSSPHRYSWISVWPKIGTRVTQTNITFIVIADIQIRHIYIYIRALYFNHSLSLSISLDLLVCLCYTLHAIQFIYIHVFVCLCSFSNVHFLISDYFRHQLKAIRSVYTKSSFKIYSFALTVFTSIDSVFSVLYLYSA